MQDREHASVLAEGFLRETATQYQSTLTYKELATLIQRESGEEMRQLLPSWIGDVLGRITRRCAEREEPNLSSLCVNASGSVGAGYTALMKRTTGQEIGDADDFAAAERLECYRFYGATIPAGGGRAVLTEKLRAARDRARPKERVVHLCTKCHTALPASRLCDYCD